MFSGLNITNACKAQNSIQIKHGLQNNSSSTFWMKLKSNSNGFQSQLPSSRSLITMEQLPWDWKKGVYPVQSKKAFEVHYNSIYKKYCRMGNSLMRGTRWELFDLERAVFSVGKSRENPALYNNLSSAWNHIFYFYSLHPNGVPPSPDMKDLIDLHFGSMRGLEQQIVRLAKAFPAGGWIWLTEKDGHFSIQNTFLNGSPLFEFGEGHRILFGIDCWEHAYYADFMDDIESYISACIYAINWQFVEINLLAKPSIYLSDDDSKWEAPEESGINPEERDIMLRLSKWRESQKQLGLYKGESEGDAHQVVPKEPKTVKEALFG